MGQLQVQKVNWWHERLAEWMLANPDKNLKDAAPVFNVTPTAIYLIHNSDAFREYWAKMSGAVSKGIADPIVEKCRAAAEVALDELIPKLTLPGTTPEMLLDTANTMLQRLGYSANAAGGGPAVQVNVNTVDPAALAAARERVLQITERAQHVITSEQAGQASSVQVSEKAEG